MNRKQKYILRIGKRGALYLQKRYLGEQLNDCLETNDEKFAEILGHKSITSTARYAKFVDATLKYAVENFVAQPSPIFNEGTEK